MTAKIYFKYINNRGRRITLKNTKTRRISQLMASDKFVEGTLRVVYGIDKGESVENEIHGGREDIQWGLREFMDKSLFL